MARRIIWTSKADSIFTEILEFYYRRNNSINYSRKLNNEINDVLHLLTIYPFLGFKSDFENVRVFIKGYFKIFYEVKPTEIVVHFIWDTRQDPKKLKL